MGDRHARERERERERQRDRETETETETEVEAEREPRSGEGEQGDPLAVEQPGREQLLHLADKAQRDLVRHLTVAGADRAQKFRHRLPQLLHRLAVARGAQLLPVRLLKPSVVYGRGAAKLPPQALKGVHQV